MKSICIFCGANFNGDERLLQTIQQLADELVRRDMSLVFGGGKVGVMGLMADAVLQRGGRAIGVIPGFLMDKEVGHTGLTELIITENMHERKQRMADLSDGVITLPGGFGTLEEFFEVLTAAQLRVHAKPIVLVNVLGYFDALDALVRETVKKGFASESILSLYSLADDAPAALAQVRKKLSE